MPAAHWFTAGEQSLQGFRSRLYENACNCLPSEILDALRFQKRSDVHRVASFDFFIGNYFGFL